ncbi:MAG: hypothetical protein V4474_04020, partial [Patescibacteria group bacterium]
ITLPEGCSSLKVERKFVVLFGENPKLPLQPPRFVVVAGPVYVRRGLDEPYRHKDLVSNLYKLHEQEMMEGGFEQHMYARSGGMLTASYDFGMWSVSFGGSSGDYGVFSPHLMLRKTQLMKALDMGFSVDYRETFKCY